jgi:REP element-mobilizing transposase RayT
MRHWLLTWTTYGTWLPGDHRGSVTAIRQHSKPATRRHENTPGTPYVGPLPGIARAAASQMTAPPVRLSDQQARAVLDQLQVTATHRGWFLNAAAVMANHVHLVVTCDGDPDPAVLLRDFKCYASRALNSQWTKPPHRTWWTDHGSKRKLPDEPACRAAIHYVQNQEHPLAIWSRSDAT